METREQRANKHVFKQASVSERFFQMLCVIRIILNSTDDYVERFDTHVPALNYSTNLACSIWSHAPMQPIQANIKTTSLYCRSDGKRHTHGMRVNSEQTQFSKNEKEEAAVTAEAEEKGKNRIYFVDRNSNNQSHMQQKSERNE